ncbi:lysylphosphatidylglycerol synthase transmembrane domain-containing protein [Thiorhodococcus fuscus]|uniref:YbhN family protein n=1 Tax=Thiorhodococcus fuscus TaxID=527200 RepID=A0ABW4Y6I5_9GAMM
MSIESDSSVPASGPLRLGRPRDWALGAALLAALVAAVHYSVGWADLLAPWRTFPPVLLLWLFMLTSASYALRAVRVHDYFRPRFSGAFAVVLRLSVLHNTANNLMPMRTGEMVFPWLMRRYFGEGFLDSAAALMWIRLLDLHFLVLLALLILNLSHPSWIWWAAAVLWVAGLAVMPRLHGLASLGFLSGAGKVREVARRVLLAVPRRPWLIVRVYCWTGLIWTLKFAAFTSVLRFFLPVDLWRLLTGVMGAELSSVLPFHGIAGSGSYEVAAVAALVPLGIDPKLALAGAVNLHLFLLGNTLVLGALAFLLPRSVKARGAGTSRNRVPDAM